MDERTRIADAIDRLGGMTVDLGVSEVDALPAQCRMRLTFIAKRAGGLYCALQRNGYICTREAKHAGLHVAHRGSYEPIIAWGVDCEDLLPPPEDEP